MNKDLKLGKTTYRVTVRPGWVLTGLAALAFGAWAILGPGVDIERLHESVAMEDCAIVDGVSSCREVPATRVVWHLEHRDAQGRVIWQEDKENAVIDEGEQSMLDVYLRGATAPTQFYIRLYNDTCAETKTLATLTSEPAVNGYAAQLIERSTVGWPTLALNAGDYQATSSQETFTASGGSWGPVNAAVLATTSDNTGKALNCLALSQARTLAAGEQLLATLTWKQQ